MSTFDIDKLLDAIRWQESRGDPNAVSPAGAKGPYQIMDFNTAEAIGDSGKVPIGGAQPIPRGMLTDEARSRQFASEAVQGLIKQYNGDVSKALAAYNAGPGNVDKGRYPAETRKYVPSVLSRYDHELASAAPGVAPAAPSPARQRFDTIMAQKNGTQQPSLLAGKQPDMMADGIAANEANERLPLTQSGSNIGADFIRGPGQTGLQTQPEPPQNITPDGSGSTLPPDPNDDDPQMLADKARIQPQAQPQNFMQRVGAGLRGADYSTLGPALMSIGGGLIAGGGNTGLGAGVMNAGEHMANADLLRRKLEAENKRDLLTNSSTDDMKEWALYRNQGGEKKFGDWMIDMKAAGSSRVNIDQKMESKFEQELGTGYGKMAIETTEAGNKALGTVQQLQLLDKLLEDVEGGRFAGVKGELGNWMAAAGLDPKEFGLDPNLGITADTVSSLTNKMTVGMIGPGGFPANNFSEADRKFIVAIFPKLGDAPQAQRIKNRVMQTIENLKVERADMWAEYRSQGKSFEEFDRDYRKQLRERDVFGEVRQYADQMMPKTGGDAPPPPAGRDAEDWADMWQHQTPEWKKRWLELHP
jgi:hypothetical protein